MYAQWFEPRWKRGAAPLVLMHGGGMTGVQYETTPDGRDGWLNFFLRRGWTVHNADAVERGRAGWAQFPDIFRGEPVFLAQPEAFERFRIGDGPGSFAKRETLEGSQFPVDLRSARASDRAALDVDRRCDHGCLYRIGGSQLPLRAGGA